MGNDNFMFQIQNQNSKFKMVFDHFECANCSEVIVDPGMTPEEVVRLVLRKSIGNKNFKSLKFQIQNQNSKFKMVFDRFERGGEDEPNCSEVIIDPDMTPEDVVRIVLEKVNNGK